MMQPNTEQKTTMPTSSCEHVSPVPAQIESEKAIQKIEHEQDNQKEDSPQQGTPFKYRPEPLEKSDEGSFDPRLNPGKQVLERINHYA
mmetsp:Transcript_9122/g.8041  ORF Transcript_9122/g.8041 Transcript_9122/m.8041 type:complete len:88 (-) Transcript_9122:412-675(-)